MPDNTTYQAYEAARAEIERAFEAARVPIREAQVAAREYRPRPFSSSGDGRTRNAPPLLDIPTIPFVSHGNVIASRGEVRTVLRDGTAVFEETGPELTPAPENPSPIGRVRWINNFTRSWTSWCYIYSHAGANETIAYLSHHVTPESTSAPTIWREYEDLPNNYEEGSILYDYPCYGFYRNDTLGMIRRIYRATDIPRMDWLMGHDETTLIGPLQATPSLREVLATAQNGRSIQERAVAAWERTGYILGCTCFSCNAVRRSRTLREETYQPSVSPQPEGTPASNTSSFVWEWADEDNLFTDRN